MGFFDGIQQAAKKKAFEICIKKYDLDGQKGLNSEELAGFITQMCKMLGVPLKCYSWQAKLAMKKIDKDKDGVANTDQLYRVFLKAESILTGSQVPQEVNNPTGPNWKQDGQLGYGGSQGIGQGMKAQSLGYYGTEVNNLPNLK